MYQASSRGWRGGGGTCYIYIWGVHMKDKIQTQKNGLTVNFAPENIVILRIFYPKIWVTILFQPQI